MKTLSVPYFYIIIISLIACQSTSDHDSPAMKDSINIHPEITIDEIRTSLENKEYSISQLTQFYLNRIEAIDKNGPKLNAVLTINPDAMTIAQQLDEEMEQGQIRGPLHGIPVLLKDNIDTHDKMPCTAGAIPMKNSFPLKDSPLASQLRDAGAVILGKTNLSEWANFHSSFSSSGWSGLGGQTNNPYELSRNPCGSSAGSGVAVSANLCVIAIGTETNGSIVCPSNNNGIVGIKPTVGLISRSGIIPISFTQDTGGPMSRTVTDAAICLGTLTQEDPNDTKTTQEGRKPQKDYTPNPAVKDLSGKRIGYFKKPLNGNVRMTQIMDQTVKDFEALGATIIEIDHIMDDDVGNKSYEVLLYEFKDGLNKYFESLGENGAVKSLEDLIEQTFSDDTEMQYFDHELLKISQSKGDLNDKEYQEALAFIMNKSRKEGIDKVMNEHNLDAIITPTGSPAWKTDLTNGDNFGGIFSSSPAAISGYPSITLPMGQMDGLPVNVSIFGRAWTEAELIQIAYCYEQKTQHRFSPTYKP